MLIKLHCSEFDKVGESSGIRRPCPRHGAVGQPGTSQHMAATNVGNSEMEKDRNSMRRTLYSVRFRSVFEPQHLLWVMNNDDMRPALLCRPTRYALSNSIPCGQIGRPWLAESSNPRKVEPTDLQPVVEQDVGLCLLRKTSCSQSGRSREPIEAISESNTFNSARVPVTTWQSSARQTHLRDCQETALRTSAN